MEIISGFPLDNSFTVLRKLIVMDPSLSLFFKVTGFSSKNTPNIIVNILEEMFEDTHRQLQLVSYEDTWEEDIEWWGRNKVALG